MVNSFNLALRFLLELAALGALAYRGFQRFDGVLRFGMMILVPLIFAVAGASFVFPTTPATRRSQFLGLPA